MGLTVNFLVPNFQVEITAAENMINFPPDFEKELEEINVNIVKETNLGILEYILPRIVDWEND